MVPTEFINSEMSLYDVRGTKIFSANISNNETIINTSGLGSGLYFVTINGNEDSFSRKLIIR
jgi:CTP-dependent riboflavin kinase